MENQKTRTDIELTALIVIAINRLNNNEKTT
jgi:hypothetical protein